MDKKTDLHLRLSEEYGLSCTGFTKFYTSQLSSLFIYPTNAQLDCSNIMLKFTLIFTLQVLLHVSV